MRAAVSAAAPAAAFPKTMLPGTSRGVTLWYAIFANASTTRLVLASPSRRLPSTTPAFLSGSTRVSSIGSTNSLNTKGEALWSRDDLSRSSPSASFEIWRSQRSPWYQGWVHSSQQTSPAASRSGPVTCNRPVVRTTRSCSALSGAAGLSEETSRVSAEADAVRDHSEDTAAVVAGVGDEAERMKVTLLSGFLGAGKTTLMKNVLRQAKEERLSLAVIVNDMVSKGERVTSEDDPAVEYEAAANEPFAVGGKWCVLYYVRFLYRTSEAGPSFDVGFLPGGACACPSTAPVESRVAVAAPCRRCTSHAALTILVQVAAPALPTLAFSPASSVAYVLWCISGDGKRAGE